MAGSCCPLCGSEMPDWNENEIRLVPERKAVVTERGVAVLTCDQFYIMEALHERRGRVVTKDRIYRLAFGHRHDPPGEMVFRQQVFKMRKVLTPIGVVIRSEWGVGLELMRETENGTSFGSVG